MIETYTFKKDNHNEITVITNIPSGRDTPILLGLQYQISDFIVDIVIYYDQTDYLHLRADVQSNTLNIRAIPQTNGGHQLINVALNYFDNILDTVDQYVRERFSRLTQLN